MRTIAAFFTLLLTLTCVTTAQPARDDHGSALAALADIQSAVGEIVRIEDSYDVGHAAYEDAAKRAKGALNDAIGEVNHMLDQEATPKWQPAIEGAKANLLAASENLDDAIGERELDDYRFDVTRALANIALAVGRPSQDGVLGGLSGALANTELAVPAGAARLSGCTLPQRAPAYGVSGGELVYVAVPRSESASPVPANLDVRSVLVRSDAVVLYTAHASACKLQRTRDVVAQAAADAPALYTTAQAQAGKAVYMRYCLQCHAPDLQGSAGPAVAGKAFLDDAKNDEWTLEDVRTTVFQNMPFSNPGSLTPQQYADVISFLLASSCFPAGSTPFPTADDPKLATIKFASLVPGRPMDSKTGTCTVK